MKVDDTKRNLIKSLLDDPEFRGALIHAQRAFHELIEKLLTEQSDTIARHFDHALSAEGHVDVAAAVIVGWYNGFDLEGDGTRGSESTRHDRLYMRSLVSALAARYASDAMAFAVKREVH